MNNNFIIKNFRVFDNEGVSLPIKPMTILTGCNSSGKSSVVKSMVLLDSYLEKLQDDFKAYNKIDLTKHILDFSTKENSTLGSFNRVLHRGSDS
jgi:predicted ATPase